MLYLLLATVICGASLAEENTPEKKLTLVEAVRLAQENNPGYHASQTASEVAEYDAAAAARLHYPRVDLFGDYLDSPLEDKRLIPRARLEDQPNLADKFSDRIATVGVRARLPLYTGGRITARAAAAEYGVKSADFGAHDTRDRLGLEVVKVFYRVLVLERIRRADEAAMHSLEESRRVVARFVKVGRSPRVDLLRIETSLATIRQALIKDDSAIETAKARLQRLLGMAESEPGSFRLVGELDFEPVDIGTETPYLTQALAQRPDYQSFSATLEAQREKVKVARADNRPQLYLGATYLNATGLDGGSRSSDDLALTLNFSQKLFDGGVISAKVSRERAHYLQLQQQLADLRLQIEFEVRTALQDMREAGDRVGNTEAVLAAAGEALRIEQLRVKTGKGIINDLLLAEDDNLQATVEHATALADHRIARAALARASGNPVIDANQTQVEQP